MTAFKIALIGEAWGEAEALAKRPFVGAAGQFLDAMLLDAGIDRSHCYLTNVFNLHPAGNRLESLCDEKSSGLCIPKLPALVPGKYLKLQYAEEVPRLLAELEEVRPNLAVLLGNTACWALLEQQAISKIRGTVCYTTRLPWLKCLPTYHPASVMREYNNRHVTVLDLIKAKREAEFPELRRPLRTIHVAERVGDIREFKEKYLDSAQRISFDIETAGEQITCIGFAPSISVSLVIPFVDQRRSMGSYWPELGDELAAWNLVADILALPCEKVAQNGLYDIQYLWMKYGIPVRNAAQDTMLLHHSLQPESEKGLGFLGSVYTNEASWKADRPRGEHTIKRED